MIASGNGKLGPFLSNGCDPLIQLYGILMAPGAFGARFSGAGFRGCCVALVDAEHGAEAASFVRREYLKLQP
ncbi:galacturonokinase [Quillaja saponaria]|uniref:Galacturonokinase n=1 Tax=Quillaja saponaria TaxID=32244 RepID=A0AAD7M4B7_QUISA|nr:galacturonokinase [Quillaja saponaria]